MRANSTSAFRHRLSLQHARLDVQVACEVEMLVDRFPLLGRKLGEVCVFGDTQTAKHSAPR